MKELSYRDLEHMVELHKRWLRHEKGGKRLVLCKYDLSNMNLSNIDFTDAAIYDCKLNGANLSSSVFKGTQIIDCSMTFVNIKGAEFTGARFENSELVGADIGIDSRTEMRTIEDMLAEADAEEQRLTECCNTHVINDNDLEAIECLADEKMIEDVDMDDAFDD